MGDKPRSNLMIAGSKDVAKDLLSTAFEKLEGLTKTPLGEAEKPRLFFPNGIELIRISIKVQPVEIELKVAGKEGVSGLLASSQEDEAGSTGEKIEDVTERPARDASKK